MTRQAVPGMLLQRTVGLMECEPFAPNEQIEVDALCMGAVT